MNENRETQTIEFKESWHDEYLEWICGYANAQGGVLFVGRSDDGKVVGVENAKKLMEIIPDKITNTMGIVADVNLHTESGLDYLEIVVEKYPSLISYHGKYFYRSGTTMRTITGKELDRVLLKQLGMTWDAIPVAAAISDVSTEAIAVFKKKSLERGRLESNELNVPDQVLFANLKVLNEKGELLRAGALAFCRDPERWVRGAYVKIGYFGDSDSDLRYQDEVHGPLLTQVDHVIDLVYTKYMKAEISYVDIQRHELYFFPKEAFREVLLNAIVHKDYSVPNPIQISVYANKIYVWNTGTFPPELNDKAKLFAKHPSIPFNPALANVFAMSGMVEAWGRGFDKIAKACGVEHMPDYQISESGVMVLCQGEIIAAKNTGSNTLPNTGSCEPINEPINEPIKVSSTSLVYEYIEHHPGAKRDEIVVGVNRSLSTVRRALDALISEKLPRIEYRGSNKTGGYYTLPLKGGAQ